MTFVNFDDADAPREVADDLLAGTKYPQPMWAYSDAMGAALISDLDLGFFGNDDSDVRRFWSEVKQILDRPPPWPVPALRRLSERRWPDLRATPTVGEVAMSSHEISESLRRQFDKGRIGGKSYVVLALQLRDGPTLVLRADAENPDARTVAVLTADDPLLTLAMFEDATGLHVERTANTTKP